MWMCWGGETGGEGGRMWMCSCYVLVCGGFLMEDATTHKQRKKEETHARANARTHLPTYLPARRHIQISI